MFIGSSSEGLAVAEHLQALLDDHFETTVWNQGVFGLTRTALDDLVRAARASDFAILVLRQDDAVVRRGRRSEVPRDNVIFELGLFIGALGPQRTFIVHSRQEPPAVPTDLLGITAALYNERKDANLLAALGPAALKIRQAASHSKPGRFKSDDATQASVNEAVTVASDLSATLNIGLAGIEHGVVDNARLARWRGNLLTALQLFFAERSSDAYTTWLRPTAAKRPTLKAVASRNLKGEQRHYTFASGEGLAGRSWSTGTAVAHSVWEPHPWWVFREGCENATYLCAPVGEPNGAGGVLAAGSDRGFELAASDLPIMRLYASFLTGVL